MTTLSSYLFARRDNNHRALQNELVRLFALAVVLELVGRIMPAGVVRSVFVLPPLLLVPGFAVLTLAFADKRPRDPVQLLIFSVATSFAVMAFNALVLNSAGIRFSVVSLSLAALVTTGAIVVVVAIRTPAATNGVPLSGALRRARSSHLPLRLFAICGSILLGGIVVAVLARSQPAPKSTPFTSISVGKSLASLAKPISVTAGEPLVIPVTATTNGESDHKYTIVTSVDGRQMTSRTLEMPETGTWKGDVAIVAPKGVSLHRVVITLKSTSAKSDSVVLYLEDHSA